MLKRTLIGLAFSAVSLGALAEAPGGPSCGWGNMIFDGQSGLPAHVLASLTNGITGNASFGMTSGTNGCSSKGKLSYSGQKWMGMSAAMMSEFSEDVARGDGDAMKAVAVSMGVEQQDRAVFAQVMHSNFNNIFTSANVTSDEVVANIVAVMKADARLSKYAA
jgi:hypothetical protein